MLLCAPLRACAETPLQTFEFADFNNTVILATGGAPRPVGSDSESEATRDKPPSNVDMDDVREQQGGASMSSAGRIAKGKHMFSAAAETNSVGLPRRFGSVHLLHAFCTFVFRVSLAQTAGSTRQSKHGLAAYTNERMRTFSSTGNAGGGTKGNPQILG